MCCPLDHVNGKLVFEKTGRNTEKFTYVHCIYDRTPDTLSDRVFRYFQRLELIEKIAEIADELFHLFGMLLQRHASVLVYQTLRNLHHAAHDVEHVLHAFCFFGDVSRLITGKFFEYQDGKRTQFDYLRTAARICHAISHLLATASFLSEHKLCQFGGLEKVFKYASIFSATGYALWTISLLWRRHQGQAQHQFGSDLGIHLAGCLFEFIPMAKMSASLAPYTFIINKIVAVAGIIHAWCVVQRLMPDQEVVRGEFSMQEQDHLVHSPHVRDHDHQHNYPHYRILKIY